MYKVQFIATHAIGDRVKIKPLSGRLGVVVAYVIERDSEQPCYMVSYDNAGALTRTMMTGAEIIADK